jgi:hypothetical protein
LSARFQDHSSDSEDLAHELMNSFAWNDLSEAEEEPKQGFTDKELEICISVSDLLALFDDFDDTWL